MNAPANLGADAHKAAMLAILDKQKAAHIRDGAPTAEQRIERIDRCIGLLVDHASDIQDAINADFGSRSREATLLTDVSGSITAPATPTSRRRWASASATAARASWRATMVRRFWPAPLRLSSACSRAL